MKPSRSRLWSLSILALVLWTASALLDSSASSALAQNRGKSGKSDNARTAPKKAEFWAVVQVGDDFQVMKKEDVKSFKKKTSDRYRDEVKAYTRAKAAAAKAKESFKEPRPVLPRVKVLKQSFKSESEANTYRDRMKATKGGGSKKGRAPSGGRDKPTSYAIVDVGGEMKIVEKSELSEMRKRADDNYRQAVKDHAQARKDAAKKKEKFTDPRPQKATIKTVGPIFKSKEKAGEYLQKMREKKDKKSRGKKGSDKEEK
jgi:hypothetical protein